MRPALLFVAALGCEPEPAEKPDTDPGTDTSGPVDDTALPLAPCDVPGTICTAAGDGGWGFLGDGPALQVPLYLPSSVNFGPGGVIEFADSNNHRIRALVDGEVATLAGNSLHAIAVAGPALASPMENPIDTARCDDAGFYIAELHAHRINYVDAQGTLTFFAGMGAIPGYSGDGGGALEATMFEPAGVVCGASGELYISDGLNHVIRVVTPDGLIDTVAGTGLPGYADGAGEVAQFYRPERLAIFEGGLYVADRFNSAVRRIDLADRTVTTVAGTGAAGFSGDGGLATEAQLKYATGIAFDPGGAMYIADGDNHVIRRVDPSGVITTIAGQPCGPELDERTGAPICHAGFAGDGGPAALALLHAPQDVAVDDAGKLWIADMINSRIRTIQLE